MTIQTIPVALYVPLELVDKFDPLTALIASDLIYWNAAKAQRWATYDMWAEWFGVSYDAIKDRRKYLSMIFDIGKTIRPIEGGRIVRGGNMYKLKQDYSHLIEVFKPVELRSGSIKTVIFPLEYINISKEVNGSPNINLAWFLCRIGHLFYERKELSLNFRNRSPIANYTQTNRRTLYRFLDIGEQAKLFKVLDNGQFAIALTNPGQKLLLTPFMVLDGNKRANLNETRLAGLTAFCERMPYENVVDWSNEVAKREIGESLLEYVKERDGLADESEAYEQLINSGEY